VCVRRRGEFSRLGFVFERFFFFRRMEISETVKDVSYFIIKCKANTSLSYSLKHGLWAVPVRKTPPQPYDILNERFEKDEVILIVSVGGSKRYQGYAIMEDKVPKTDITFDGLANEVSLDCRLSPTFKIKWIVSYPNLSEGLLFEETEHLVNPIKNCLVNKSRNFDELPPEIGSELCELIRLDSISTTSRLLEYSHKMQNKIKKPTPYHEANPPVQSTDHASKELYPPKFNTDCLAKIFSGQLSLVKQSIQQELILTPSFTEFLTSPDPVGIQIVGVVSPQISQILCSETPLVFLSGYTIMKTREKHQDISVSDYYRIQNLLDYGEAIKEGRPQYSRHIVFFYPEREYYLSVVIKSTQNGDSIFIQTFFHSALRELERTRKRGQVIRTLQDPNYPLGMNNT